MFSGVGKHFDVAGTDGHGDIVIKHQAILDGKVLTNATLRRSWRELKKRGY
jgi:hypothetical protein